MSLFGRIAWTGAALLVAAALLALLVWKPASQRAFVTRTEEILRSAERDFGAIATSRVEGTMEFAAEAALAADEQRALAIAELPLDLFTDADGRLAPERLRETVRAAAAAPGMAGGEKHAAVRAEILERTRREVQERLRALRRTHIEAAARHGELAGWRTLAAWGGLLLLLLAGWALALDRVVLRPVRAATDAVARFGAGERGLRLDPRGAAELARLGRAFNETAAAVERAESENAELRARLEEKVKERTAALVRAARAATAGTMARGVAHEFNNLLGGILGCTEAALGEDPAPEVRDAIEMIRKTAGRGVGVTQALLRATRAEPELERCNPAILLEEALEEVRPPEGVEVVRDLAGVSLRADAAMLRQVLANLVRNAVEAMEGKGRLGLRVARVHDEVRLEVSDSGPGIDDAVREVLFEPFVTTRQGGREGAGLGLFLAERLVAAHGGRIGVESRPGRGTRFTVHLPSARDS
ncbi:MAG: sensor histidine kinase [Planctomycetota bacterium]|jgi:signal transduction histidine kinase